MTFPLKTLSFTLLCAFSGLANTASDQVQIITDFAREGIDNLQERSFKDSTRYQVIQQQDRWVLKAETKGQASALYHQTKIDLQKTPFLNWRWRVDRAMPLSDPHSKDQDDYPARVYVVFQYGIFPWQIRTLNYVWANKRPSLNRWANPFTDQAIMIPLKNADDHLGNWFGERVNVPRDYQRAFGESIDRALGVAIMTDGDNSNGSALAFYGDLYFSN